MSCERCGETIRYERYYEVLEWSGDHLAYHLGCFAQSAEQDTEYRVVVRFADAGEESE